MMLTKFLLGLLLAIFLPLRSTIFLLSSQLPVRIITPTPTLTPSPTPTPEAFSGYCLNVPILYYHHIQSNEQARAKGQTSLSVDPKMFEQQLSYLDEQGYTVIGIDELVSALKNKTGVPKNSIVITLDDGYKDDFENGYTLLKKYNKKAAFLIPPGLIGGADYMSWGEVKHLADDSSMTLLNHTYSHYPVGLGDEAKIKFEIEKGKEILEQQTGKKITLFGYPYGNMGEISTKVLQQDGYAAAFSTMHGSTQCDSNILFLRRNGVGNAPLSAFGY